MPVLDPLYDASAFGAFSSAGDAVLHADAADSTFTRVSGWPNG